MFDETLILLSTLDAEEVSKITWPLAATIIGVVTVILETVIRMSNNNSKAKSTVKDIKDTNKESLTDSEIVYLKNLSQNVMNNSNKLSNLDLKIKNLESISDDLKMLIRDAEKENFNSLSNVSNKIDVLKNILLEAKMNSKK